MLERAALAGPESTQQPPSRTVPPPFPTPVVQLVRSHRKRQPSDVPHFGCFLGQSLQLPTHFVIQFGPKSVRPAKVNIASRSARNPRELHHGSFKTVG
jgi:hypothetical protein